MPERSVLRIYTLDNIKDIERNCACIGFFDGVHKGHRKLIDRTVSLSKRKGIMPCCITFPESEFANNRLTSLERRLELLEQYGIEAVILLPLNDEVKNTEADDFIRNYLNAFNIDTLVCGFDFTYGRKALGNVKTLKENRDRNFRISEVPEYTYKGQKVSSTYIRELLEKGEEKLALKLLGHEL